MDQEVPASVGRASDRTTIRAISGQLLITDAVNSMTSPAETEALSADLATSMAAPRTSTEAEAVSDPSLVVVTLAVLSTGEEVAVAAVVGEETCTFFFNDPATTEIYTLSLHDALPILV